MSIEEQHLSSVQIEWFASESVQINQPEALSGPLEVARRHISTCHSCSEKVNNYSEATRVLQTLAGVGTRARTADCPDETICFETVAGTASTEETLANLRHASQCDHCGQLLKK